MLLFCLATPAPADLIISDQDPLDVNSLYWSGSDINPADNLNNSGINTEEAWLNALLGNAQPGDATWVELTWKDEDDSNGWQYPVDWTYAVLKYGSPQAPVTGFDHWAIYNNDGPGGAIDFTGLGLSTRALSHISFNGTPVPEPATMLLLGSGLLGLGVFGRKKKK